MNAHKYLCNIILELHKIMQRFYTITGKILTFLKSVMFRKLKCFCAVIRSPNLILNTRSYCKNALKICPYLPYSTVIK